MHKAAGSEIRACPVVYMHPFDAAAGFRTGRQIHGQKEVGVLVNIWTHIDSFFFA
jgi:hypothetical protein